jgi:hypothetical protein
MTVLRRQQAPDAIRFPRIAFWTRPALEQKSKPLSARQAELRAAASSLPYGWELTIESESLSDAVCAGLRHVVGCVVTKPPARVFQRLLEAGSYALSHPSHWYTTFPYRPGFISLV